MNPKFDQVPPRAEVPAAPDTNLIDPEVAPGSDEEVALAFIDLLKQDGLVEHPVTDVEAEKIREGLETALSEYRFVLAELQGRRQKVLDVLVGAGFITEEAINAPGFDAKFEETLNGFLAEKRA